MRNHEFSQITTRGGDHGESSLADGERMRKDDLYFETLGTLDELVSYIGIIRSIVDEESGKRLAEEQKRIQIISGMVAVPPGSPTFTSLPKLSAGDVDGIEGEESRLMGEISIPSEFLLPGDTTVSAHIHVARTICRRAERRMVSCIRDRHSSHLTLPQSYLNRLADYFFVLALWWEQKRQK